MQNDFVQKTGEAYIPGTELVVENISQILTKARDKNFPIIHIVRLYKEDGNNVDLCRRELIAMGKKIVTPDTFGSQTTLGCIL